MFRLSAWISESRGEKLVNGVTDISMAPAAGPAVNAHGGGALLKRKRDSSEDVPDAIADSVHDAKRRKPELDPHAPPQEIAADGRVKGSKSQAAAGGRVRDIIESQFGLEIMLKHQELRLIHQELAKCQVALEQLRRCHLIPYSTSQESPETMLNVSSGTGPALSQKGDALQWAPSYGVTDGPYTRHYAKWLIPDPSFDGMPYNMASEGSHLSKNSIEGRSTRHSFAMENSTPTNKSRSQRNSVGGGLKLQALSSGYPEPKGKQGPSTLKRHQDGQMVKLVCIDCKRENFSSTQGFINHCRIAHHRDFKSHEEAAIASGQPVEVDESGAVVGEERTQTSASNGLVNPLIHTAASDKQAYVDLLSRIESSMALFEQGKHPGVTEIPSSSSVTSKKTKPNPIRAQNKSFVPSSSTPNLSEMLRKKGLAVDLSKHVDEAKKLVDFEEYSPLDEESDEGEASNLGRSGGSAMRMPARAAVSPAPFGRPGSSKGIDGSGRFSGISPRLSHATPVINTSASHLPLSTQTARHDEESGMDGDMTSPSYSDLSPNTNASNNARAPPSLVSDNDGDDDAESVSSHSGGEDDDSDVAEIDIEDDGVEKVPRVVKDRGNRKEEKHVTFVSTPMKKRRKG